MAEVTSYPLGRTGPETKALLDKIDGLDMTKYVPATRKVNGKALSADVTLAASDVGALGASAKAADSAKLNGQSASYYGTAANVQAATSISYSVTASASAWVSGSLTHLGQTYTYKAALTASAAKGTGKGVIIEPTAGSQADLQAWGVADIGSGTVTLWSKSKPSGSITLRITEVF